MVSLFRTKQRKRDNIDETVSLEYSLGIIDENVRTRDVTIPGPALVFHNISAVFRRLLR